MIGTDIFSLLVDNSSFLLNGMKVTLQITLCAILIGILLGTFLAIIRLYAPKPLAFIAALYVNTFRSIPLIMVLMWFYLVIGPSFQKFLGLDSTSNIRLTWAMIAFSLFEAAYYSEIVRAGIQSVNKEQYNAALALGMTKIQSLIYIILPQAFKNMIPLLLTQAIILFQDTSLVYVMSLTDFFRATEIIGARSIETRMQSIIVAAVVYFIICFSLSMFIKYLQSRKKYDQI